MIVYERRAISCVCARSTATDVRHRVFAGSDCGADEEEADSHHASSRRCGFDFCSRDGGALADCDCHDHEGSRMANADVDVCHGRECGCVSEVEAAAAVASGCVDAAGGSARSDVGAVSGRGADAAKESGGVVLGSVSWTVYASVDEVESVSVSATVIASKSASENGGAVRGRILSVGNIYGYCHIKTYPAAPPTSPASVTPATISRTFVTWAPTAVPWRSLVSPVSSTSPSAPTTSTSTLTTF